MPYIQLEDKQYPLPIGDLRVGTDENADVQLTETYGSSGAAIVTVATDNNVTIRREKATGIVKVNGVQLGAEPSPLIHGDKIEIAGQEFLFGDDKKGGSTQYVSGADVAAMAKARGGGAPAKPTLATGGRLVSLVDGREYTVHSTGLTIGRDAACDIVVPSTEVSRRHAEVKPADNGYQVIDLSTNGVLVNGERIQGSQVLGRGDVLKLGNEEFRFYADSAKTDKPTPSGSAAAVSQAAGGASPRPAAPAVQGKLLATLEIINEGVMKGTKFEIRSPLTHVGRGAHNDIPIQDESVSDSHAKIQKRDAGWFVVDMASTNGTYVAGRRITGEQMLSGAPDVRFGHIKMIFRATADAVEDAGKGTKMIAGVTAQQAQAAQQARALRGSATQAPRQTAAEVVAPPPPPPVKGGIPAGVWVVAAVVVLAALFFIMKGL